MQDEFQIGYRVNLNPDAQICMEVSCAAMVEKEIWIGVWIEQLKLVNPRRSAKLLCKHLPVPFALHDHCTRMTLSTNREVWTHGTMQRQSLPYM